MKPGEGGVKFWTPYARIFHKEDVEPSPLPTSPLISLGGGGLPRYELWPAHPPQYNLTNLSISESYPPWPASESLNL